MIFTLIIVMGIGTFVEKYQGTETAFGLIYGSWWFAALWAIAAVGSLWGLIKSKLYLNLSLFLLHISFILILLGALCTRISSIQAYAVLNKGKEISVIETDSKEMLQLPFSLKLDSFYISYYEGTNSPSDYISLLSIKDSKGTIQTQVSMNKIIVHQGFRLYQSSYEDNKTTSILSVNYDPWGIPITYSGYALFAIAMLWFLLGRNKHFWQLLSHPVLKKSVGLMLFFALAFTSGLKANNQAIKDIIVPKQQAQEFGKLLMLYNGRICPVASFAKDFSLKLTGKSSIGNINSEQILCGFLFFPEKWQQAAIFEVKNPELKKLLNAETHNAAYNDFFDTHFQYKLARYDSLAPLGNKSALAKEIEKLNDKVQLVNMLHSGFLLKLFPAKIGHEIMWFSPIQSYPTLIPEADARFMRAILTNYYQSLQQKKYTESDKIIAEIRSFQLQHAGKSLPSSTKQQAELLFLKLDSTALLFKINLTLGFLSLIIFFVLKDRKKKYIDTLTDVATTGIFIFHSATIALRSYIGGRIPFSNGFETMLIIAWFAMLLSILLGRKIRILKPFGLLISGFALLVAHLGMSNPGITPLVPVLSSPLLSIHVSIIMIAYTLLAFVALNSLISIIQIIFSKKNKFYETEITLEQNKLYSLICIYPALFFLGCGIFIGAVWANVSWGRYWAWDPKEVWALITFLVYSLSLHEKNWSFLQNAFNFHVFGFLSFSSVLMTYFGVNYFLGGMHSYAGEGQSIGLCWSIVSLSLSLLLIFWAKYKLKQSIILK